jgi:hypothetical protein
MLGILLVQAVGIAVFELAAASLDGAIKVSAATSPASGSTAPPPAAAGATGTTAGAPAAGTPPSPGPAESP